MNTDRLLTAYQVAMLLDCSAQRVYQMVRDEILPSVRFGRSLRFRAAALEEWLESGGRGHAGGWRRKVPRSTGKGRGQYLGGST
jgi:excisionase family DNA binding protein